MVNHGFIVSANISKVNIGAGYFQPSELMGPLDSMQGLNLQLYNTKEIILSIH